MSPGQFAGGRRGPRPSIARAYRSAKPRGRPAPGGFGGSDDVDLSDTTSGYQTAQQRAQCAVSASVFHLHPIGVRFIQRRAKPHLEKRTPRATTMSKGCGFPKDGSLGRDRSWQSRRLSLFKP